MRLVIFGLSITSSWGNGHATLWRGLCRALVRKGYRIDFYERDTDYYAQHRDLTSLPGVNIVLYGEWDSVQAQASRSLQDADLAIVTSYCPDAKAAAARVMQSAAGVKIFYDLDTPVTLARLARGETVDYVPDNGYRDFDLVLSYTGGRALEELTRVLGARRAVPLYGSVDPDVHFPVAPRAEWQGDLSYLGTFAADRQAALQRLFVEPARRLPGHRFIMGGAMYDHRFPWTANLFFHPHVAPPDHPAFYCSSRATLNVTRADMAAMGYCPQGRIFEAAACGAPILSDAWEGLDTFLNPGEEIFVVNSTEDVLDVLNSSDETLARVARRARERVLEQHTADRRASDFEQALNAVELQEAV